MKALLASAAAATMFIATPAFAQAGPASTANTRADAVIVQPIQLNQLNRSGLNFGRIAADTAPSQVTVAADGSARTSSNPNVLIASAWSAAQYSVAGEAGLAYSINVPATISLTGPTGSTPMSVALNSSKSGGTLDSAGADTFGVGGVLSVGDRQLAGAYSGSFNVSVIYN